MVHKYVRMNVLLVIQKRILCTSRGNNPVVVMKLHTQPHSNYQGITAIVVPLLNMMSMKWRLYPNRAKKEIFNFRIHIYIVETCNFNVLLYAIHTDWLLLLTQCEYRMLYLQKVEPQSAKYFCWIEYLIQFFFHPTTYISGDDVKLAKKSLPPNTFLLFLLMLFVIVSQRSSGNPVSKKFKVWTSKRRT